MKDDNRLVTLEHPHSSVSEIYRRVRTNIEFTSIDVNIKTLNITSTIASEAKTTTTCNLAVMYANKFPKVLLIDADLRKPMVHRFLKLKNISGLTNCLLEFSNQQAKLDKTDLKSYIQKFTHEELMYPIDVMTSGTKITNPAEFLGSQTFKKLLTQLKDHYDIIVLDSAPSGLIVDGIIVSNACDATLFVIEHNTIKVDQAQHTVDALKKDGANVIGTVITKAPVQSPFYKRYYKRYYYYRHEEDENHGS